MDLVDIIAEKRFLGQEFVTWLWYKSHERGGVVDIPGVGDIILVFEKHLLLEYGVGESLEKLICQGLQAELTEARTGLRMGKKLEQARVHIGRGEYEWDLTIRASMFDFKSVKTPKTMAASEESDDASALEGRVLEKIGMIEQVLHLVDEMFRMYLNVRLSEEWGKELVKVRDWINTKERSVE